MASSNKAALVSRQHQSNPSWNTLDLRALEIRLHDRFLNPMPEARYLLKVGDARFLGRANGEGWLHEKVGALSDECTVCWSAKTEAGAEPREEGDFEYTLRVYLRISDNDREEALFRRLHNVGCPYERGDDEARRGAITAFQAAHTDRGLEMTGEADEATFNVLKQVHDECDLRTEVQGQTSESGEGGASPDQDAGDGVEDAEKK